MKVRENCWEHKKCGRQEGGENVEQLGLCPTPKNRDWFCASPKIRVSDLKK